MGKTLNTAYNLQQRPAKNTKGPGSSRIIERPEGYKVGMGMTPDQRVLKGAVAGLGHSPDHAKIKAGLAAVANKGGAGDGGLGSIIDAIQGSMDNPYYNMDVIEQVRWTMLGPQTDESVGKNFGAEIDLFGSGKSPVGIDYVETTMAQTGQTQTYFIACFLGVHLEPEPLCFTALGNGWTHPDNAQSAPPSPDVFTANDVNNGCLGAAFQPGEGVASQFLVPAVMEWGWWANYVAWHLVRAYNLRWKIGQHTNIMDEVLRHSAYMPTNGQDGSASNSEVDIANFVARMNQRYDQLGSALDFLKVNAIRVGSSGTSPNVGIFSPSRDEQRVGVTYGGMDLRSLLHGNSEFRKLALPYVIKPGVPIGLILEECDTAQATIMRQYLSITQGLGGVFPPVIVDEENISGVYTASGGAIALERTLDGSNVSQAYPVGTAIFKGGDLKISLMIKGFEVTEDWYNVMSSNADIRSVVMNACGIRFAMQGG
jgi:hypothetical protein